jgi:hypothetical protein
MAENAARAGVKMDSGKLEFARQPTSPAQGKIQRIGV